MLAIVLAPETRAVTSPRPRYRPQHVSVPPRSRGRFFAAAAAVAITFAIFGLITSLAPSFLAETLHQPSHALAGAVSFALFAAAALTQTLTGARAPRELLAAAIPALLTGIGLLTLAVWVPSPSFGIFLAGDLIAGAGAGLMFKGAIGTVLEISLPERHAEGPEAFGPPRPARVRPAPTSLPLTRSHDADNSHRNHPAWPGRLRHHSRRIRSVGDRRRRLEFGWGPQQDEQSIAAIQHALELGVNWIDTAAGYGFGHSETVVGRALQGVTERPYVFTKASLREGPDHRVVHSLKRDSILREAYASLERLGVDAIDLYQIHWPIPDEDIEEGWSAFAELKEQGLVRHIGVSNFDVEQLRRIQQIASVETLQPGVT